MRSNPGPRWELRSTVAVVAVAAAAAAEMAAAAPIDGILAVAGAAAPERQTARGDAGVPFAAAGIAERGLGPGRGRLAWPAAAAASAFS